MGIVNAMDFADRKLIFEDMRRRAISAGFMRFDGDGVMVLELADDAQAKTKPKAASRPEPGDALPGLEGRQGGDGQVQSPIVGADASRG